MPTLLNIQSSPRGLNSISRTLSQDFVSAWKTRNPAGTVLLRDLADSSLPFVSIPWINGIFLPADQHTPEMQRALAISDELIAELLSADEILIGTPMYNFTVPANLKAWIDLVVRPRVTHSGPPERKGLVIGKACKIIIASGGTYDADLPSAASDYESGYLKRILAFVGITDVEIILAGGTAAIAFGTTTVQELAAQFRPAVLAAAR
jgi:FMN-dependent NADH-azoreductase